MQKIKTRLDGKRKDYDREKRSDKETDENKRENQDWVDAYEDEYLVEGCSACKYPSCPFFSTRPFFDPFHVHVCRHIACIGRAYQPISRNEIAAAD